MLRNGARDNLGMVRAREPSDAAILPGWPRLENELMVGREKPIAFGFSARNLLVHAA